MFKALAEAFPQIELKQVDYDVLPAKRIVKKLSISGIGDSTPTLS